MSEYWEFPELTEAENAEITAARHLGFALFWPATDQQATLTLAGASTTSRSTKLLATASAPSAGAAKTPH